MPESNAQQPPAPGSLEAIAAEFNAIRGGPPGLRAPIIGPAGTHPPPPAGHQAAAGAGSQTADPEADAAAARLGAEALRQWSEVFRGETISDVALVEVLGRAGKGEIAANGLASLIRRVSEATGHSKDPGIVRVAIDAALAGDFAQLRREPAKASETSKATAAAAPPQQPDPAAASLVSMIQGRLGAAGQAFGIRGLPKGGAK